MASQPCSYTVLRDPCPAEGALAPSWRMRLQTGSTGLWPARERGHYGAAGCLSDLGPLSARSLSVSSEDPCSCARHSRQKAVFRPQSLLSRPLLLASRGPTLLYLPCYHHASSAEGATCSGTGLEGLGKHPL